MNHIIDKSASEGIPNNRRDSALPVEIPCRQPWESRLPALLQQWFVTLRQFFHQSPPLPTFRWERLDRDTPDNALLREWSSCELKSYELWLNRHGVVSERDWQALRRTAQNWSPWPMISIITPVYDTDPEQLAECVLSVRLQAYTDWEMCLVDDGSRRPDTLELLEKLIAREPRLKLQRLPDNQGICEATNRALAMARGEYVAFLDHDDRLAPDALFHLAAAVRQHPEIDILYSDTDMISPQGLRYRHQFKPTWSPETLLSGNYLFHLIAYRRSLINKLGGVRAEHPGAQDYDLVLRAAEQNPTVKHIPRVLYHWRKHERAASLQSDVQEQIFRSGVGALRGALERRGLRGDVEETPGSWGRHYRVRLDAPPAPTWRLIKLPPDIHPRAYVSYLQQILDAAHENYLVILAPGVEPENNAAITELLGWFQIPGVGLVTGKVIDDNNRILHAGLTHRVSGLPLAFYERFPEDDTPGYMASATIVRNVITPHPGCFAIRRDLLNNLGGLDSAYGGPHALLDFGLRALASGKRCVYTPFARFRSHHSWWRIQDWPQKDRRRFAAQWATWLQAGDPYYNPWLSLKHSDMRLDWNS